MAETLLDLEEGVTTINALRIQNLNSDSEIAIGEDETENYNEWEYKDPREIKSSWANYLPYLGENIVDYDSYDFYEACSFIAENEGDPSELDFDDLDNYINSTDQSLRYFDSVNEIARRAADWKIEDELINDREYLLRYYAICYYIDNYNDSYIPEELVD